MSALFDLTSELTRVPNVAYVVFWCVEPNILKVPSMTQADAGKSTFYRTRLKLKGIPLITTMKQGRSVDFVPQSLVS